MNVGVVGLGYWGTKVLEEYAALRNENEVATVVGCDVDQSKLNVGDVADRVVATVDELTGAVDAVHVCTGSHTHYDVAKTALDDGLDVLLEKPLTMDRDRAYHLVELASANGSILQTGHIFRFADVVRRVREMYRNGQFGDVYYFNVRWTHRIRPMENTNVVWDLLPHPIDILQFVTGTWPDVICGTVGRFRTGEHVDAASVAYRLADEIANVEVSWVDPIKRRTLEIVGSDRSAVVDCVDQTISLRGQSGTESIDLTANNTIRAEARNFIQAIETHENAYNSAIVGARTVDVIEATREALEL